MADVNTLSHRTAKHQAALATTGIDPTWDRALHAYLRADVLQHADTQFGAIAKANELRAHQQAEIFAKFGKEWRSNSEAQALEKVSYEQMSAADEVWANSFCAAFWRAGRELVLTPAPTIAAATFKASVIEADEIWNDSEFPGDCMEVLQGDLVRLQREGV